MSVTEKLRNNLRSSLMNTLDRSVETSALESKLLKLHSFLSHSRNKLCLIVHLVAEWTVINISVATIQKLKWYESEGKGETDWKKCLGSHVLWNNFKFNLVKMGKWLCSQRTDSNGFFKHMQIEIYLSTWPRAAVFFFRIQSGNRICAPVSSVIQLTLLVLLVARTRTVKKCDGRVEPLL